MAQVHTINLGQGEISRKPVYTTHKQLVKKAQKLVHKVAAPKA